MEKDYNKDVALQLAHNPNDTPEDVIKRAEKYRQFLAQKD